MKLSRCVYLPRLEKISDIANWAQYAVNIICACPKKEAVIGLQLVIDFNIVIGLQ